MIFGTLNVAGLSALQPADAAATGRPAPRSSATPASDRVPAMTQAPAWLTDAASVLLLHDAQLAEAEDATAAGLKPSTATVEMAHAPLIPTGAADASAGAASASATASAASSRLATVGADYHAWLAKAAATLVRAEAPDAAAASTATATVQSAVPAAAEDANPISATGEAVNAAASSLF